MFKREFVGTAPDYSDKKLWLAMPESPDMPVDVTICIRQAVMIRKQVTSVRSMTRA